MSFFTYFKRKPALLCKVEVVHDDSQEHRVMNIGATPGLPRKHEPSRVLPPECAACPDCRKWGLFLTLIPVSIL